MRSPFSTSQKDIYYQTENNGSEKPATCGLRSDLQNKWDQVLKMDYECDLAGDAWEKLVPGASSEFDKSDQAFAKGVVGFVVLLNEKPSYWGPTLQCMADISARGDLTKSFRSIKKTLHSQFAHTFTTHGRQLLDPTRDNRSHGPIVPRLTIVRGLMSISFVVRMRPGTHT